MARWLTDDFGPWLKAIRPKARGVTIGEAGNAYDNGPPAEAALDASVPRKRGKAPVELDRCKEWLARELSAQPARVNDVRARAALAGYSPTALYEAGTRLDVLEYAVDGRKW